MNQDSQPRDWNHQYRGHSHRHRDHSHPAASRYAITALERLRHQHHGSGRDIRGTRGYGINFSWLVVAADRRVQRRWAAAQDATATDPATYLQRRTDGMISHSLWLARMWLYHVAQQANVSCVPEFGRRETPHVQTVHLSLRKVDILTFYRIPLIRPSLISNFRWHLSDRSY